MINFLRETIQILKDNGLTEEDVVWVGEYDGKLAISWDAFALYAKDIDYENLADNYRVNIAVDLVVVGENWWLERNDCEGAEWWEFKKMPTRSNSSQAFVNLAGGKWDKLQKLQDKSD